MNFTAAWNHAIENGKPEREIVPRDYIYASELGKPRADVWLRMHGVKPTNPANARSRRKFETGYVFEWIAGLVLNRVGLLQDAQVKCQHQIPGLCRVSGYMDYKIGWRGAVADTWSEQVQKIEHLTNLKMPDVFTRAGVSVGRSLIELGESIPDEGAEVKSVSAIMFERLLKIGRGLRIHRLQLRHYLISEKLERGQLIYISKDDLRLLSIPVFANDAEEMADYENEVAALTENYRKPDRPPNEPCVIWDHELGKFSVNRMVGYSDFLTLLYPQYENPEAFDTHNRAIQSRFNRVIARMKAISEGKTTKTGKPITLTPKNTLALEEMQKAGHDPAKLLAEFIASETEEEEEE